MGNIIRSNQKPLKTFTREKSTPTSRLPTTRPGRWRYIVGPYESPIQYARVDMRLTATKRDVCDDSRQITTSCGRSRHFAMNRDVLRQIAASCDESRSFCKRLLQTPEVLGTLRISAIIDLDVRTASVAMKILNIVCPKNRF